MVINIVPNALAHSDWDAHFDPWTDGRDRRAAGPAYTQWPGNLLVKHAALALPGIAPCTYSL